MHAINELLQELSSRLPELEWKISELSTAISSHRLPHGLFRFKAELTPEGCIEEIKADIDALSKQKNERSAYYLAERLKQKVNVLVVLCQIEGRKNKPKQKASFGLNMLSTRQQWIQSLENDIQTLTMQQQAMLKTLEQNHVCKDKNASLSVHAELGEVERRLTLAREKLDQVIC
jgi:DNA primase